MTNNDWVQEYIKLMKADNPEEAIPLKEKHFPRGFYKYRYLNKNILNSLKDNWLWCPNIKTLNDPFECSFLMDKTALFINHVVNGSFRKLFKQRFNIEFTQSEIDKIASSKTPYNQFIEIAEQKNFKVKSPDIPDLENSEAWLGYKTSARDTMHICSFSEINDSILMWSHYADEHKGICIEYDFFDSDDIRAFIQPVYYSDTIYTINSFDEMDSINAVMASIVKSKDWTYEREWRYTNWKKTTKEDLHKMKVPIAKAIYIGPRFTLNKLEYHQKELFKIARTKNIPVFQMGPHLSSFKMEIKEQIM